MIIPNCSKRYSILSCTTQSIYIRLKYTYSLISVNINSLPGNTKKEGIDKFEAFRSAISPSLSQHPAIFWHFCGNFRSVRGDLQKSRYEKRTEQIFCTRSETWSENRTSRFEPKILLISFSRGSGSPSRWASVFLERTRILSGIQFTTHFVIFFVVETKRFVGSNVDVILTRQTCGQRSSRAVESKRGALVNCFLSKFAISS